MRYSWRENGGEGSPGSAALSLYARNNILMKERPDSEVPTSGRAAELLASPPLRGRPLPPLHDTGSAECAPCLDCPHQSVHHHTEPRSRAPLRRGRRSSCAVVTAGVSGRGLMLRRGVASPTLDAAFSRLAGGGGCSQSRSPSATRIAAPTTGRGCGWPKTALPRQRKSRERLCRDTADTRVGVETRVGCSCFATSRISFR